MSSTLTIAKKYALGSTGCHELLDRTSMLADMVEGYLVNRPSGKTQPEWHRLAENAAAAIRELHQQVGSEHLSAECPNP